MNSINTLFHVFFVISISSIAIAAVFLVAAKIFKIITKAILRRLKSKFAILNKFEDIITTSELTTFRLILAIGIYFACMNLDNTFAIANSKEYAEFIKIYPFIVGITRALTGLSYILIAYIIMISMFRISAIFFDWYENKITVERSLLSNNLFILLKKLTKVGIFLLALVIVLAHFKIDISGLLVSLGVGSLAIALAAQETLSNMIAGFIIMVDRPFKIGDRIKLPAGDSGDVFEIGFRSTKILDFDHNMLIIPNAEMIKSKIVNVNTPTQKTRILLTFTVGYDSNVDKIKSMVIEIAQKEEKIIKDSIEIAIIGLTDLGIQFQLTCQTETYKSAWGIKCSLFERIVNDLQANKVKLPSKAVNSEAKINS